MKYILIVTLLASLPLSIIVVFVTLPFVILGKLSDKLLFVTANWVDYLADEVEQA